VDTNEEQTFTLDGRFKFKETMKITKYTGVSDCAGCALASLREVAPPCSPGARKDGKRGIWVKA
jgi:hypothetical protein